MIIPINYKGVIRNAEVLGKTIIDATTKEGGEQELVVVFVRFEGETEVRAFDDKTYHEMNYGIPSSYSEIKIMSKAKEIRERIDKARELYRKYGEFLPKRNDDGESDLFYEVQKEMEELHARKNKDYNGAFDKILDAYKSKAMGVAYGSGRLYEKASRIMNIVANGQAEVKEESVEDTIFDIGVYATMLTAWLKKFKEHG